VIFNSALECIKKYVQEPCAPDETRAVNINAGLSARPHYRYCGGTNLVECFNRLLNAVHLERFAEDLADAVLIGLAHRFDQTEKRLFRKLPGCSFQVEPTVQNRFIKQQTEMLALGLIPPKFVLFESAFLF
jgi:hypothetical protein